jgi:signal transduction histidine kinase
MQKKRLANLFFSKEIQNSPSDLRSAWLILVTCCIAGLSCFGIILQGFALEITWSMVWILIGHSLVTFFPFSLRFFSSMYWPSRIFGIVTIAQIMNAIYQTGGMDSEVFYAYAALPILLSFVLGLESILFNAILSFTGILCIYYLDQIGHEFPNPQSTDFIHLCIILWGILTSWLVGYYSRYQYVVIQEKLEEELQRRKKIQIALEEQHNNKDRFFAYLSHEIRNPLTSILGTTEKILIDITDENLKKQMRRLQKNTFQVNELLEQVLDFSSLHAEQITLHMENIDIIGFLEDVLELHRDICEQKNIQIEIKKPLLYEENYVKHNKKIFIQADYVRLQQIISNILSNAIKFSDGDDNQIQIFVEIVNSVSPSSSIEQDVYTSNVRIICQDEGCGINEKDLDKIFLPYQRSQSTKKGAGLGLAICKSLVETMDGQIFVQSSPSNGSSFSIQFPECIDSTNDRHPPSFRAQEDFLFAKNILSKETKVANEDKEYQSDLSIPVETIHSKS